MAKYKISDVCPKVRKTLWLRSLDLLCYFKLDEKQWAEMYFQRLVKSKKAGVIIGKEKLIFE